MKVSLAMLLKTNVEIMSEYRPLAMLMKTHGLKMISGDVDEIKGDGRSESNRPNIGLSGHRGICDFRFEIDDPRLRIGDLRRQN